MGPAPIPVREPKVVTHIVDERTRTLQKPSSAIITAIQADPKADLRRERSNASFASRELAALMVGGEANLVLREKIAAAVRADPVFSKKGKYFMERSELYRTTLEKYLALPKLAVSMGEKDPIAVGRIIRELIDEPGGLDLHLGGGSRLPNPYPFCSKRFATQPPTL
mmetsp:Transcript_12993/g.21100  ORF Transcript_12993/g.21100 Transcript_12993/m.21100 type:complete len:167 (-) Transcript_12993:169-669(-)